MAAKEKGKTPKKECPRCCKAVIPNFKQLCPLCGGNFTPDIKHTEPAEQMTFKSPALNAMVTKMNSDLRKNAKREQYAPRTSNATNWGKVARMSFIILFPLVVFNIFYFVVFEGDTDGAACAFTVLAIVPFLFAVLDR